MPDQITTALDEIRRRYSQTNGNDPTRQVASAADSLRLAGNFASSLTTVLQNAQNAISGLYVKDDPS